MGPQFADENRLTSMIAIHNITTNADDYSAELNRFGLWWPDFEEVGLRTVWAAFDGEDLIGFATVDGDGRCFAIEVVGACQRRGVGTALVEAAGCYCPVADECPGFWSKF